MNLRTIFLNIEKKVKLASAGFFFFLTPCGYPLDLLFVELGGFCSNVV